MLQGHDRTVSYHVTPVDPGTNQVSGLVTVVHKAAGPGF